MEVPDSNKLLEFTLNKIKELLDIEILQRDINNIFQIKSDQIAPIKIEFVSYLKKQTVLKNANKLKGKNIFISQDLIYEDRKDRKLLQTHLKAARSKNLYAKIKGNSLQINDDIYTIEQLQKIDIGSDRMKFTF